MCCVCLFMLAAAYLSDSTLSNVREYISTDEDSFSGLFVNAEGKVTEDTSDSEMTCDNGYATSGSCRFEYAMGYVEVDQGNRICDS